ncbi:MAG: DUF2779 domain-containing protein [Bacteroidales bacterium]|nr:DUF2779 domain-containing protein [Bacteroidales bacterium]
MEKHILSKSTYIKGEQCLKQIYLTKNQPKLRDRMPPERIAIFSRGTNVGIYAQDLFPGGIDAGPKHYSQYRKAIETTAQLIADGQEVIYEAAFQAHHTLILLDILVKNGDAWDAYEVKSSPYLTETYYKDAALQYYVLVNSGVNIRSFSLISIDGNYTYSEEIDIHQLFTIKDVTEEVKERMPKVALKIDEQLGVITQEDAPQIEIGPHCYKPYDCDFIGHCWKGVNRPSIFEIPSLNKEQQFDLFNKYKTLEHCLESPDLNQINRMQIRSQLSKRPYKNNEAVQSFIPKYEEAYILKVLSFKPALPRYTGSKPYQAFAFGFALQKIKANGSKGDIIRYMANGKKNPNDIVIAKLKEVLEENIPIFTYSSSKDISIPFKTIDLSELIRLGHFYRPKITKDYTSKSLAIAMGIRPPFKAIEMDIVAAQYYNDIIDGHKDTQDRMLRIRDFLDRELRILSGLLFAL